MEALERLARTIKDTALCGLGNTAPNPVLTTLMYFKDEYEAHIKDGTCPAKVCTPLLRFEVNEDKCTACGTCYKACPVEAIEWQKKQKARILKDRCIKCRSCIQACNFKAID
jgi:ferredoxin